MNDSAAVPPFGIGKETGGDEAERDGKGDKDGADEPLAADGEVSGAKVVDGTIHVEPGNHDDDRRDSERNPGEAEAAVDSGGDEAGNSGADEGGDGRVDAEERDQGQTQRVGEGADETGGRGHFE